jgi:hypothetical protein
MLGLLASPCHSMNLQCQPDSPLLLLSYHGSSVQRPLPMLWACFKSTHRFLSQTGPLQCPQLPAGRRPPSIQQPACYGVTSSLPHQFFIATSPLRCPQLQDGQKETHRASRRVCVIAAENICCSAWVSQTFDIPHFYPSFQLFLLTRVGIEPMATLYEGLHSAI